MKKPSPTDNQPSFLFPNLLDQLNPKHPLLQLAKRLPWDFLSKSFLRCMPPLDDRRSRFD
jgi:IS5 family transposase